MKAFLVGGAVRDKLLGLPVSERDWVVVGETPEHMLQLGFRAVGKHFPVFLHPQTQEEYALARTERKTKPGYQGFVVHAAPDVALEQDLVRRDLTINAIAMLPDGQYVDPYGGITDLKAKILRHISPAFSEDPVRILRVARLYARFAHLNFSIAPDTEQLMRHMVENGEIDALVPERVWAETAKALTEQTPAAFFQVLKSCGALARIFPELDVLFGVPQPKQYHPEIDTGVHSLLSLEQAALLSNKATVRFAALVHDLGKAATPRQHWPSHHGHEKAGLPILKQLCQRLRVPNQFSSLAAQVMQFHTHCHRILELRPSTIVELLNSLGAFKKDNKFIDFLHACEADAKGRTGLEYRAYPQATLGLLAQQAGIMITSKHISIEHLQGAEIGSAIRELRIKTIKTCKQEFLQQI